MVLPLLLVDRRDFRKLQRILQTYKSMDTLCRLRTRVARCCAPSGIRIRIPRSKRQNVTRCRVQGALSKPPILRCREPTLNRGSSGRIGSCGPAPEPSLLIYTQHNRLIAGIRIESDDIAHLGREFEIL